MTNERAEELWQKLHALAEPSGEEIRTARFLAENLQNCGFSVQTGVGGHGVIGTLSSDRPGPVVALLADMDALTHCVNNVPTVMHSCAHDANCAMVLTAAEQLTKERLPGKLKIIFQPAEETFAGAKAMIADGAAEGIDILIGIHLRPRQEMPLGQCTPALYHSAACALDIVLSGLSAHAARPHLGCNVIDAGAAVVNAVNAIHLDPSHTFSVKTTRFQAGGPATNIIPDLAHLTLDLRADNDADMDTLLERARTAAAAAAAATGAKAETSVRGACPAANYDPGLVALAEQAILTVLGKNGLCPPLPTNGGEDFHYFVKHNPALKAVYLGLGADLAPGLHTPSMHFNHAALPLGVRLLTCLAKLAATESKQPHQP